MDQTADVNLQTTPEQVGAAAAQAQAIAQDRARRDARLDKLDIRDPSQPREPKPAPAEKPAERKPAESNAIPGANVESWPDHLMQAAWNLGIGMDDAKSFGTPANLERALGVMQRQVRQAEPPRQPEAPPDGAEDALPFEYPASDDPNDADAIFNIRGAEWFKNQNQYWHERDKARAAELAEIKKQNEQLQTHLQRQEARQQEREWSETIASETPEEYRELLGKSLYDSTTAQQQNQYRLAQSVQLMIDRANQDGRRVEPIKTLYKKALAIEFPEVVQKSQDKKTANQARDAMGQFLDRPTSVERNGNSRSRNMGEAERTLAAERAVHNRGRELGIW